jgi:hypothetical protein
VTTLPPGSPGSLAQAQAGRLLAEVEAHPGHLGLSPLLLAHLNTVLAAARTTPAAAAAVPALRPQGARAPPLVGLLPACC